MFSALFLETLGNAKHINREKYSVIDFKFYRVYLKFFFNQKHIFVLKIHQNYILYHLQAGTGISFFFLKNPDFYRNTCNTCIAITIVSETF